MRNFFATNRRDGARMISSALLVFTIGATQIDHGWGQFLTVLSMTVCIFWGIAYRKLDR